MDGWMERREKRWEGGRGGEREGGERGKVRVREGGREGWKSVYTRIRVGTETQEATFVCTNVFPVQCTCSVLQYTKLEILIIT